ncbi:MAG TPA: hypothetical protein VD788_05710 [Candidatus Polarisedimenticolaceae bacterium]|nr:hypothetical protein [Candidatus Polarisedimenticolaceae bacterium]
MKRLIDSIAPRGLIPALVACLAIVAVPLVEAGSLQDFERRERPSSGAKITTPPVGRDCDAEFTPDKHNDRIDCKTENANAALYDYIDTVVEFDMMRRNMGREPIFTDSQMDQLMTARERAQAAKNRSHEAETFRGAVKKQKAEDEDCYTKEIIGDNRGDDVQPCEAGEDCEELLDDGIGNDDGKCMLKGNNREVCVQVCQQPLLSDMDTYDADQAGDFEQGLEEIETALVDATEETKRAMARMRDAYDASRGTANECDMFQFDLRPTAAARQVAQVAKNATGATFNGCSVVCNQDAFGWNCEAACLVFAIIDGIANAINDALDVADSNNGSAQLDRVARCTTQLDSEIQEISADVDGTAAALDDVNERLDGVTDRLAALTEQIDALSAMMVQRFNAVDGYLCVPQGQRECFPGGQHDASRSGGGFSIERSGGESLPGRR